MNSKRERVWCCLTGVVFPGIAIAFAASGEQASIRSPWQADALWVYASLLIGWPAILALLPLIVYSATAMLVLTITPHANRFYLLRVGIYSGVPLSLACLSLILVATGFVSFVAAAVVSLTVGLGLYVASEIASRWKRFSIAQAMGLTTIIAFGAATLSYMELTRPLSSMIWPCLLVLVAATPTLTFVTYIYAARSLKRNRGPTSLSPPIHVFTLISGVVAWVYSWKAAVDVMVGEYARLPRTSPNCYVASAAAHGHPTFVRSTSCEATPSFPLNRQMQRCKLLELALAAASPSLHRIMRQLYDQFGPLLASCCRRNVWFADVSYVALKPLEMVSEVVRLSCGTTIDQLQSIYRGHSGSES